MFCLVFGEPYSHVLFGFFGEPHSHVLFGFLGSLTPMFCLVFGEPHSHVLFCMAFREPNSQPKCFVWLSGSLTPSQSLSFSWRPDPLNLMTFIIFGLMELQFVVA